MIESYKRFLSVPESSPFPITSSHHYNYYSFPVMNLLNWNRLKNAFEILEKYRLLNRNFVVLDAGCGGGVTLPTLAKYYKEVYAVDYSDSIKIVKQWFLQNYQGNVNFKKADIKNLPFQNRQFDMVCSFDVLEHIRDVEAASLKLKEY